MPTAKPRVQVTVTPAQFDLLRRLSKLQQRSMSAVLSELFATIEPVLERVAVVLEAAVRAQSSALDGLRSATEDAQAEIEPLLTNALGQLDLLVQAAGVDQAAARTPPPASGGGRSRAPASAAPPPALALTPPALTGGSGAGRTTTRRTGKRTSPGVQGLAALVARQVRRGPQVSVKVKARRRK